MGGGGRQFSQGVQTLRPIEREGRGGGDGRWWIKMHTSHHKYNSELPYVKNRFNRQHCIVRKHLSAEQKAYKKSPDVSLM